MQIRRWFLCLSSIYVVIVLSSCSSTTKSYNNEAYSLYNSCLVAKNGDVLGVGANINDEEQWEWVVFKNDKTLSRIEKDDTLGDHIIESFCWLEGSRRIHIVWPGYETKPTQSSRLYHISYDFKSNTWGALSILWNKEEATFDWDRDNPSMYIDDSNKVYIAFEESMEASPSIKSAVILELTSSTRNTINIPFVHAVYPTNGQRYKYRWFGRPSFTIDSEGRFYISFMNRFFVDEKPGESIKFNVFLMHSDDKGETWSDPVRVAQTSGSSPHGLHTWLDQNQIHVLWLENSISKKVNRLGYSYSVDRGSNWSEPIYIDPQGQNILWRDICTDSNGRTHLTVGDIRINSLNYYVLENNKWQHIEDLDFSNEYTNFLGISTPRLTCDKSQVYVYMNIIEEAIEGEQNKFTNAIRRIDHLE